MRVSKPLLHLGAGAMKYSCSAHMNRDRFVVIDIRCITMADILLCCKPLASTRSSSQQKRV